MTTIVVEHSTHPVLNIHGEHSYIICHSEVNQYSLRHTGRGNDRRGRTLHIEHFTYLGNVVGTQGGTEAGVKARIGKASVTFLQLGNMWKPTVISLQIKINISNTYVNAVLLYEAETWSITVTTAQRIQTFVNTCLRRIRDVWCSDTIRMNGCGNVRTCQVLVEQEIRQSRWRRIGHTLR